MPSTSLSFSFLWISLIITNVVPLISLTKANRKTQRNLDSPLHSILLRKDDLWYGFSVVVDSEDSDDLYMPNVWAVSLYSNETVISNGGCHLFARFICSSPDCYEDTTSLYFHKFPTFSTSDATRLNLTAQTISIAGGGWKINSSPLYISSCEGFVGPGLRGFALGQIGLGLSGRAYQNFQTSNPVFSIIFYNKFTIELIFGFNSSYVNQSQTPISILCDLDWNVQVNSMTIGNSTFVDSPTTLIFDLGNIDVSLPPAYYTAVRTYLFQMLDTPSCADEPKTNSFYCAYHGNLNDLPSLVLNLENGAQFVLSPITYAIGPRSIYTIRFCQYNSTFSGVEYIVLGRRTMFNYYTVFEQLSNHTPIITLYPVTHTPLDDSPEGNQALVYSNQTEAITESNSSTNSNAPSSTTLYENLPSSLSETKNISNTLEPQSIDNSSEVRTEVPFNVRNDNTEESAHMVYVILIIIFFAFICGIIGYLYMKKPSVTHEKMVKEHNSTLELHGTSYIVPSENYTQDDFEGTACE